MAAPAPVTIGIPYARARIAACDVGLPLASTTACTASAIEVRRLCRREVGRDDDARGLRRPPERRRGAAAQGRRRFVRRRHGRAGRSPRVAAQVARGAVHHGVPGTCCAVARVDARADVVKQRGIVEQQRVRVEDRGVGVARCCRDLSSRRIDLVAREFDGLRESGPLRVGRPRLVVGDRRPPAVEHVCRPDGNARRSAHRAAAVGSTSRLLASGRRLGNVVEPTLGKRHHGVAGTLRVRTPRSEFQPGRLRARRASRRPTNSTREPARVPVRKLRSHTRASKPRTVETRRAAGRACSPCAFVTTKVADAAGGP